jgi:murein DD-endopeptidase MepM/ murein hydrolase activator NlpD
MASLQLPGYPVTQPYGCTGFALEPRVGDCAHFHQGIDFAVPMGTPVAAPADGVVQQVIHSATGLGNHVILDIGNGYTVQLGHLSSTAVQVGQRVSAGTVLGLSGSTGASTGPHLHFEVDKGGATVDPASIGQTGNILTNGVGAIGNAAGQAAGAIANNIPGLTGVTDSIGALSSGFSAIGAYVGKLFDPGTWTRAVLVIGGIGLVLIGGAWIVSESGD